MASTFQTVWQCDLVMQTILRPACKLSFLALNRSFSKARVRSRNVQSHNGGDHVRRPEVSDGQQSRWHHNLGVRLIVSKRGDHPQHYLDDPWNADAKPAQTGFFGLSHSYIC